jgi:hypothetical protein
MIEERAAARGGLGSEQRKQVESLFQKARSTKVFPDRSSCVCARLRRSSKHR